MTLEQFVGVVCFVVIVLVINAAYIWRRFK